MLIADYTIDHPTLRQTSQTVPGLELTWEDSNPGPDGRLRLLCWASCDDGAPLDEALATDPSVTDPVVLAETSERRLLRLDYGGAGREASLLPVLGEVGGVHQRAVGTADGWRLRTRFPDRAAFERIYQFCREHDLAFTFHRVYERSTLYGPGVPQLTPVQHETLVAAVESGYLDIPRRASLAELGERLGVSESATSERFRRGVKALVQRTLPREPSDSRPEQLADAGGQQG